MVSATPRAKLAALLTFAGAVRRIRFRGVPPLYDAKFTGTTQRDPALPAKPDEQREHWSFESRPEHGLVLPPDTLPVPFRLR
jgi:hypothetical protein